MLIFSTHRAANTCEIVSITYPRTFRCFHVYQVNRNRVLETIDFVVEQLCEIRRSEKTTKFLHFNVKNGLKSNDDLGDFTKNLKNN